MMLDELYATQQIHQEEQALEIKETIFIRIQWTYLLNYIKQTHHKRYGDNSLVILLPDSLLLNRCFLGFFF